MSDKAIASVWDGVPVQCCTVHKHRNLFAHAPERLHDEITADYSDMIYATTPEEIEVRRKAFIRKWRLKHRAVADSLEEAGERLFTFPRLPPSQWRSVMQSSVCTRNSSAGSRPKPFCRRLTLLRCCSGR
jgi:putative transposase